MLQSKSSIFSGFWKQEYHKNNKINLMINHGSWSNFCDKWNTASGPDIASHKDKGATYDLSISSGESTVYMDLNTVCCYKPQHYTTNAEPCSHKWHIRMKGLIKAKLFYLSELMVMAFTCYYEFSLGKITIHFSPSCKKVTLVNKVFTLR